MTDTPGEAAIQSLASAESLYQFERITDHQISPDGSHILLARERLNRQTLKKYSDLWLIRQSDGAQRRFTYGDYTDSAPRWSPDGAMIAFLSNRLDESQPQLFILPFHGGEARPLTDLKGTFLGFEWSPDSQHIAFAFRKKDADALAREADENKKKLGIVARHITRVTYKLNGAGYLPQEKAHLWVVNVADGQATQLTDGMLYEEGAPRWSPDGAHLIFASNRSPDPDFDEDAVDLFTIPAGGGEMRLIPTPEGSKGAPSYAPDGRRIAYLGRQYKQNWWQNSCLYLVSADGGDARNLTAEADLHLSAVTNGDIYSGFGLDAPRWSPDGRWLYVGASVRGEQPILRVSVESGAVERVTYQGAVIRFNFDAEGRYMAYFSGDWRDPGQLYIQDLHSGGTRQLTQDNAWLGNEPGGDLTEVWLTRPDGGDLHGWIMTPPDFDPARQYPAILQIHGGPQTQYGNKFMHEFHYLAANGYVIGFCNPRGSQGYGDDFARAILGQWGTVDYDDVMQFADHLAALPYVDADRVGVTGGSYGGFMTTLIIGRSQRFKAAVAQRLVSNWTSMYGSCDFNWGWKILAGVGDPWEDFERHWQQSPMSQIGRARTPMLIIHSEDDYRTNLEQAEQVFVALKVLGVDTEMVLFPGETHDLSRSGRLDRRVARLEHMLRWFDKYLKGKEEAK